MSRAKSLESRVNSQKPGFALRSYAWPSALSPQPSARPPAPSPQPPRRALTLIELLVVIIILTTIGAAAIPILAPADDDRSKREASRGLNTFITGAQARAIALNRPFGIALKRLGQDTNQNKITNPQHVDNGICLEVFYVEQQPPYSGFDANSRARLALYTPANANVYIGQTALVLIQFVTRGTGIAMTTDGLPTGWDADLFPTGMVRPGDIIEINGTRYQLLASASDSNTKANLDANGYYTSETGRTNVNLAPQIVALALNDTGQMLNMTHDDRGNEIGTVSVAYNPYFTSPAPYKIHRQAMPTSDEPYQLPEGTAIDLRASGVGSNDYFYWPGAHDNPHGVQIMFSPEGTVSRVSFSRMPNDGLPFDEPVTDNVYLLIGKRENIPPAASTDPTLNSVGVNNAVTQEQKDKLREPINWLNGTSRWVVIGSQSGRIATIENAFVDLPQMVTNSTHPDPEYRRVDQILAAREFTREMAQMGGR